MTPETHDLMVTLLAQTLRLQQQLDESALNEIALIATLKELVPGFGPRFDQLHNGARILFAGENSQILERLLSELESAHE